MYGHSSIVVDNDTLYILFGADASHNLHNDVHVLNLTSFKWFDQNENMTTDDFNLNNTSNPLSTGAIVGISIGSVVGVNILKITYIEIKKKSKRTFINISIYIYRQVFLLAVLF